MHTCKCKNIYSVSLTHTNLLFISLIPKHKHIIERDSNMPVSLQIGCLWELTEKRTRIFFYFVSGPTPKIKGKMTREDINGDYQHCAL